MTRTVLLRTGVFARASSLSVKALRLYHEMGLLVPSVVDPATGYRGYSPAQLADAAIIRLLRGVGVPLQDIRTVLITRDRGFVRKVLTDQAERFQAGLDAVAGLIDDLYLEEPDEGGVVVRREAAHQVLALDGTAPIAELGPLLRRSEKTLTEAASASGAVAEGCFGACFPIPIEEGRQEFTGYLPIPAPVTVPPEFRSAGVRVDELPECDVAVLEHHGPYWGLDSCYRRLGVWVAFHAEASEHPLRENYRRWEGGPGQDPVTELLWPVATRGAS